MLTNLNLHRKRLKTVHLHWGFTETAQNTCSLSVLQLCLQLVDGSLALRWSTACNWLSVAKGHSCSEEQVSRREVCLRLHTDGTDWCRISWLHSGPRWAHREMDGCLMDHHKGKLVAWIAHQLVDTVPVAYFLCPGSDHPPFLKPLNEHKKCLHYRM